MVSKVIDYFDRVTALFFAAYGGKAKEVEGLSNLPEYQGLIDHPINTQGDHTNLFFACYGSANVATVRALLAAGADPLKRDNMGRTPIHIAANTADPEILAELLSDVKTQHLIDDQATVTMQTPFHALCYPGSGAHGMTKKPDSANLIRCFEILLEYSACKDDVKAVLTDEDTHKLTPLAIAKYYVTKGQLDREFLRYLVKLLLKQSFAANENPPELTPSIIDAAIDVIKLPENIEQSLEFDFYGRNTLLEAALVNGKDIVRAELEKGKDVNVVNPQSDRNALQLACSGLADGEMVKILLQHTTAPLRADSRGRTAVHFAANTGRIDTVTALLEDPTIASCASALLDADQRTVLHAAAMAGSRIEQRLQVIDKLFELGIDYKAKDINGDTALDIARIRGEEHPDASMRAAYATMVDHLNTKIMQRLSEAGRLRATLDGSRLILTEASTMLAEGDSAIAEEASDADVDTTLQLGQGEGDTLILADSAAGDAKAAPRGPRPRTPSV